MSSKVVITHAPTKQGTERTMQTNSSTTSSITTSTGSNYSHGGHDNRVQLILIYDFILGVGCILCTILALANLLIMTINKFVRYYSRQIDRIVMDESFDSDESDESDESHDDDDSESEFSEYSENESSEYTESDSDDGDSNYYSRSYKNKNNIKLTITTRASYVPPRRSERLLLNRAKCNSPLLVRRLRFD
jgi:hypothetical protein